MYYKCGATTMLNSRTIDLHIQRLRRKLDWGDKIQSVYKVGYKLV
ncbi:MAG: winged helix-turn-helix domain-containing protein [Eubacterium ventriosum]